MIHTLHQNASIEVVLDTTDIGGVADTTSKWIDMENFGTVDFICQLGATLEGTPDGWDALDSLDEFHLLQATDSAGTGSKIITGANDDQTDTETGVAGDIHAITLHTEAMDMDNNFPFVCAYVTGDTDTNPDWVTIIAIRYNPRYSHKALTTSKTTVIV